MRGFFWLVFGGIWAIVGIVLFIVGGAAFLADRDFEAGARQTEGIVLTKDFVPADSDSSTQYRIRYRFTSDQGTPVEGSSDVSVERWEALEERGPVAIEYLPGDPGRSRLVGATDTLSWLFLLLGLIFGPIGIFLVARSVRGLLFERRLRRDGVPALATVSGIEATSITINRSQQFRIRYRFTDPTGRTHEGRSGYVDWSVATVWQPGQPAAIRYDPTDPAKSIWIGQPEPGPVAIDAPAR
jgi:hypothetical protein